MAVDSKTKLHYVQMGSIKWAWRAKAKAYDGIQTALGVKDAKDTDDNIVIGANFPTPPRVRLNLANKKSVIRICDPSKLEEVITKNTLNGKKHNGQNINSVEVVVG